MWSRLLGLTITFVSGVLLLMLAITSVSFNLDTKTILLAAFAFGIGFLVPRRS